MKTLIPFVILALCVYYYWATHRPPPPESETETPAAPVAEATPPPAPQRLYYHSPLDAPAMPADAHTVSGYYSTEPGAVWKMVPAGDRTVARPFGPDSDSAQTSAASNTPR